MKLLKAAGMVAIAIAFNAQAIAQELSPDLAAYAISARQPAMQAQCTASGGGRAVANAYSSWSARNSEAISRGRLEMQARLPTGNTLARYEEVISRGVAASFASLTPDKRAKRCASYVISLNAR